MEECIFCKIVAKQLPAKVLYEDDDVIVFPDIHPVRQVHLLVIPKQHIQELISVEDPQLLVKLLAVVQNMIAREGLKDKGYRVSMNGGGAQIVQHFHIHLMGPMKKTDMMG